MQSRALSIKYGMSDGDDASGVVPVPAAAAAAVGLLLLLYSCTGCLTPPIGLMLTRIADLPSGMPRITALLPEGPHLHKQDRGAGVPERIGACPSCIGAVRRCSRALISLLAHVSSFICGGFFS